jgi:large subunit ribosomal protein L4
MKVDVLNLEGKKVSTTELPAAIFEAPIKPDLMHQALVRQLANARLGTHSTKTRGEVSGGGRKPWRQKGTGRARQGSTRSPIWVGGGGAHTPHPHGYTLRMPRKMRRAALRSALSVKAAEAGIVIVDEMRLPTPRPARWLRCCGAGSGTDGVDRHAASDEQVERSVWQLSQAKILGELPEHPRHPASIACRCQFARGSSPIWVRFAVTPLRRPAPPQTEKCNFQSTKLNQYTFEVPVSVNKAQIKEAVESLFDVSVQRVNVIILPAKRTRRARSRRLRVRRSAMKKAVVTLAEGQSIDVFEGVK